jgi:plasmid stability protein
MSHAILCHSSRAAADCSGKSECSASIVVNELHVEAAMATLTIRGLDEETHRRLRVLAAEHGRSMEAEVRAILAERLSAPEPEYGLGSRIHARFAELGGVDLELPPRDDMPRAAVFDE